MKPTPARPPAISQNWPKTALSGNPRPSMREMPGLWAQRFAHARRRRSVEDRVAGARALELEEAVRAGYQQHAVPELAGRFAARDGRHDRAEEGDSGYGDHWRAHVH